MPSTGMPSAIFASIAERLGNSCCISRARWRTASLSSSSRLGGSATRADRLGQRALVGDREGADLLDLVAEEVDAVRVVGDRREDVEDAAAHRELAAPRDHVDARVGEVDELRRRGAPRSYPRPPVGRSIGAMSVEVVGERLQRGAHRGDDEERACSRSPCAQSRQPAQRVEALADDLGARAEALVRQGLPGRELDDLGVREQAGAVRRGWTRTRGRSR